MLVMGIETSCDETAVGIVQDRMMLKANVIASQVSLHAPFGGVVPEVAARAHLDQMIPTIDAALAKARVTLGDLDAIAVTHGPGLAGALLVGVSAAKGLALAEGLPLIGVNHLRAHVEVSQLEAGNLEPPLLALIVSGGHTSIVRMNEDFSFQELGTTIDDAAGEAFDKIARFIGLPFPGGPEIDRLARDGNPHAFAFPRALANDGTYNLSFSGLKTAVVRELRRLDAAGEELQLADVAASFQEALVDVKQQKVFAAAKNEGLDQIVLAGGVAANSRLRDVFADACRQHNMRLIVPSPALCTDNGAMVAASGANLLARGVVNDLTLATSPGLGLDA